MKKFLVFNLIFILVVFSIAAVMVTSNGGLIFASQVGQITVTYMEGPYGGETIEENAPLFSRGDGQGETSSRRRRRTQMLDANAFEREGQRIIGWQNLNEPEESMLAPGAWLPAGITEDVTFYAVWENIYYTVRFDMNVSSA